MDRPAISPAIVARTHDLSFEVKIAGKEKHLLNSSVMVAGIVSARVHAYKRGVVIAVPVFEQRLQVNPSGKRLPCQFRRTRNQEPTLFHDNSRNAWTAADPGQQLFTQPLRRNDRDGFSYEAGYLGKRKHFPYTILALVEVLLKELSFSSIERAQGVHGCKVMQVIVGNALVLFHRPPA